MNIHNVKGLVIKWWLNQVLFNREYINGSITPQIKRSTTTTRAAALANQVIYEFSLLGTVKFWKHNVVKNKNRK